MGFPNLEVEWTPTIMGSTLKVVSEDAAAVEAFGTNLGASLDALFSGAPAVFHTILRHLRHAVVKASQGQDGGENKVSFPVSATVRFPGVRASPGTDFSRGIAVWDLHAVARADSMSNARASVVAVPSSVVPRPVTTTVGSGAAAASASKGEGGGEDTASADAGGSLFEGGNDATAAEETVDSLMRHLRGFAFDHLHEIFLLADFGGMLERVNPETERVLGWTEAELTARPYESFIHPDDVEKTRELVDNSVLHGYPVSQFTNRWRKKHGGWATISWHGIPNFETGQHIAIGRDVTAEIDSRSAAIRALRRLRVIMDSVNDGIIECDMQGRIVSVDGGLRQMLACPADPAPIPFASISEIMVSGQNAFQVAGDDPSGDDVDDEANDGTAEDIVNSSNGNLVNRMLKRRVTQNVRLLRTDRSEVLVDMTAALFEPKGKPEAKATMIVTIRDVADRVHAELEAQAHSDALQRLEVKNAFVASMSHEIRTPLNGILGAVETLMDEDLPERHLELIATAYDCGSTLLSTINAILEDSKEASIHGESISMDWFILRAAIDDALVAVRSRAEAGSVMLSCEIDDALPAMLKGDAGKFRQVLINLLSNAVKFCSVGGKVSVHAWLIDGAPRERASKHMSSSSSNSSSSTSSGMSVPAPASTIAMIHTTEDDDGSSEIEQPVSTGRSGSSTRSVTSGSSSSTGQIWMRLEVRDTGVGIDKDKLETIFEAFAQADASISKVYGGTGLGLNICKRIVEAMNGRIWAESEPGIGSTFVVECMFGRSRPATTSTSQSSASGLELDTIKESLEHEHEGHRRSRHVKIQPLRAKRRSGYSSVSTQAAEPEPVNVSVLVIDDFPPNLLVIKSILSHLGCIVDTSRSAEEALSLISSEDSPVYSLILTDVNMPRMNGIEFTEHVVRKMGYPAPVVVVTAGGDSHRESAFEAGASGYLKKPVSKSSLHSIVTKHTCLVSPGEESEAPRLQVLYADDAEINGEVARLIIDSLGSSLTFVDNAAVALRALVAGWSRGSPGAGCHPSEVDGAIAAVGVDPAHPDLRGEIPSSVPKGGFDVVFLDEHMPGMDGTVAVRALRSIESTHGLPRTFVAILSGETGQAFENEATKAGADMVLAKPFSKRTITTAISAALKRRRRHAMTAAMSTASAASSMRSNSSPNSQRHTGDVPPAPIIDVEAVMDLGTLPIIPRVLDLTTDELDLWSAEMLEINCSKARKGDDSDDSIDDINSNNNNNDDVDNCGPGMKLALSKLHKIKGAAGNVGLARLAAMAAEMEEEVKEIGCAEPKKMMARIRRELGRARGAIDAWRSADE